VSTRRRARLSVGWGFVLTSVYGGACMGYIVLGPAAYLSSGPALRDLLLPVKVLTLSPHPGSQAVRIFNE
jgi:hypothetical protein